MSSFKSKIDIIGINPFVLLPTSLLANLFKQAGKDKGPIPVCLWINGTRFIQTLVRFRGEWRLYINTPMLKVAQKKVGDTIHVKIEFDPKERLTPMHPKLEKALKKDKEAKRVFDNLPPYVRKEIMRYINSLKSETSIDPNVARAIRFLNGKERFVGRGK